MYIRRGIRLERSFQKSKDERHVGKTALRLHYARPKWKDTYNSPNPGWYILYRAQPEGQIHDPKGYQKTNPKTLDYINCMSITNSVKWEHLHVLYDLCVRNCEDVYVYIYLHL